MVRNFVALVGLLFGVVASASCSGSVDTSGTGGTSSTGGTSGSVCTLAGTRCALGCAPTLGCTECATNADCIDPSKPACVLGKCTECGPDAACGAAEACYPRNQKCEPKCSTNSDCPSNAPICVTATGACVGCQTNADCMGVKDQPICEPTRAQCSACASSADCGAAAPVCNLNDGQCHECLVDDDCPTSYVCATDHNCHAP